ncbi:MAG: hypothetical protein ACRBN8_17540 [Nannocystales bacterium]
MTTVQESTSSVEGPPAGQELQFGYNHNFRHQGRLFHVQTEDSGGPHGHIHSHIFFAGTVIASRKTEYRAHRHSRGQIQVLMRHSHREMCISLRDGKYDERIAALTSRPAAVRRRRTNTELAPVCSGPAPADTPEKTPAAPLTPSFGTSSSGSAAGHQCLSSIERGVAGFLAAALVDQANGTTLRALGSPDNTRLAVSGSQGLLQAKMRLLEQLDLAGTLEDILISLDHWFCILRPVDDARFLCVVLDRTEGNLAMARRVVSTAAAEFKP